jgi:hypothetical protein
MRWATVAEREARRPYRFGACALPRRAPTPAPRRRDPDRFVARFGPPRVTRRVYVYGAGGVCILASRRISGLVYRRCGGVCAKPHPPEP